MNSLRNYTSFLLPKYINEQTYQIKNRYDKHGDDDDPYRHDIRIKLFVYVIYQGCYNFFFQEQLCFFVFHHDYNMR